MVALPNLKLQGTKTRTSAARVRIFPIVTPKSNHNA